MSPRMFGALARTISATALAVVVATSMVLPVLAQSSGASTAGATIDGSVTDSVSGAPIAGAAVFIGNGVNSYTAKSDARGKFTLANVQPGVYSIAAAETGYVAARIDDYAIVAGNTYALVVTLRSLDINSLRTIASVHTSAHGRGTFNDSTASISVVSSSVFAQQGQSQVMQVLDQVPGFYTAHESANNNPAAPGAASYPNIRGAQTYETASMVDGHAVARVGGGYRTQYLNPALFQDVEVIKGPGATSPTINYAIAGTVNFVTLEPTLTPHTELSYGIDSWGSQTFDVRSTGSIGANHKLSYALVYANNGQNGYAQGTRVLFPIGQWVSVGTAGARTSTGGSPTGPYAYVDSNPNPVIPPAPSASNHGLPVLNPNTANQNNYGETGLYACCGNIYTFNNESAQLVKLRYTFSDATTLTYSFMATHGETNENGNHFWQADTIFNPALNMTGASATQIKAVNAASYNVPVGGSFAFDDNYLVPDQLRHQDEPINQIDLKTTFGKNITILARGFSAVTTNDATNGVASPDATVTTYANVYGAFTPCYGATGLSGLNAAYGNNYGANCGGSGTNKANPIIYNGQYEPITYGPGPQQSPYCLNPNFNPASPSANGYYMSPTGSGTTGVSKGVQTGVASSTALGLTCGVGSPGYVGLFQKGITGCNNFTGPPNCAYFASNERDSILGGTLEGFLNAGPNTYTFSYDANETQVTQFYYLNMPNIMPVPPGDKQSFASWMERADIAFSPKLNGTFTLYQNRYLFHTSLDNGFSFQDQDYSHFDERAGLTYQPNFRTSIRFSAGSSIAPPYIFGILSTGSHIPGAAPTPSFTNAGPNSYYSIAEINPNLAPETAFGYDLGGDYRLNPNTVVSVDTYLENIFNQYLISAGGGGIEIGTYNDGTDGTFPIFQQGPVNVARAKLYGAELSINSDPSVGFGYVLNAALQRAYPYNIDCSVYGLPLATHGCYAPNGNLAEIPGVNYLVPGGGTGVNTGQNNVTGTARNAIPYSQGYGELDYRLRNGTLFWYGTQYYGANNTYNRPAFTVGSLGVTVPVLGTKSGDSIRFAVYNVWNAYPLAYVQQDQGNLIPTITPQNPALPSLLGLTNGLNIGPARYSFQFTKRF